MHTFWNYSKKGKWNGVKLSPVKIKSR